MINKKAFTLTELLVALGIIGAVAALSIPSLMNTINERIMITRLKSTLDTFQKVVDAQKIKYRTNDLTNTDFTDSEKLLKNNFDYVKYCPKDEYYECWGAKVKTDKVYRKCYGKAVTVDGPYRNSVLLKNGMSLSYYYIPDGSSDKTIKGSKNPSDNVALGELCFDFNASDAPNIVGKDYLCVYLSTKGRMIGAFELRDIEVFPECSEEKGYHSADFFIERIIEAGWSMNYTVE